MCGARPLLNLRFSDAPLAGRRIWILSPSVCKHTGSFKFRGGWSAGIGAGIVGTRPTGVIAFSSGIMPGVAYAAKLQRAALR